MNKFIVSFAFILMSATTFAKKNTQNEDLSRFPAAEKGEFLCDKVSYRNSVESRLITSIIARNCDTSKPFATYPTRNGGPVMVCCTK